MEKPGVRPARPTRPEGRGATPRRTVRRNRAHRRPSRGFFGTSAVPPLLLGGVLLLAAAALSAQVVYRGGRTGWRPNPIKEGLPDGRRGGFTFCRLLYTHVRSEDGGHGWNTDYPASDNNFMVRLAELTGTYISMWRDGEAGYAVVRPTDPSLFECPFLFASDVGTIGLSTREAALLREYFLRGGLLWVDDFWGERAWAHWVSEIQRVLPEYPIVEIRPGHPIFASVYQVSEMPQIPSIQHWRRSGGGTSERGYESAEPHLRGIFDEEGHLLVLMSHNTDIADGWEREGENEFYFASFSPESYALGINVAVWSMVH